MAKWYYMLAAGTLGPVSDAELKTLAENGTIRRQTRVRREQGQWAVAGQVKGLFVQEAAENVAIDADNVRWVAVDAGGTIEVQSVLVHEIALDESSGAVNPKPTIPPLPTAITASAVPAPKPAVHSTQLQSELHEAMADDYGHEIRNSGAMTCLFIIVALSFTGSVVTMMASVENESSGVFAAGASAFVFAIACAAGLVLLDKLISLLAIIAVELRLIRKRLTPPADRHESSGPTLR